MALKAILGTAFVLTAFTSSMVSAATVSDLTPRTDLFSTTYSLDLGQVDETGAASVSALLALWNSNGNISPTNPQMTLNFSVNSTFVTTIDLTSTSGFSESLGESISGLLVDGLNDFSFSILNDFTSGNPATFAVKDFSVTFTDGVAAVPLPASALLLLGGLVSLGSLGRRRRPA